MALKGKPIAIGTTDTDIYVCPSTIESSVHGLVFANSTGSSVTLTVKLYIQSLGTTTTIISGLSVSANSSYTWPKPINLNASDKIIASASTGSAIVALFSVYEGSAAPVSVGFTPRGTWSSGASYVTNDVVTVSGTSYLALQASTNQNPTSATAYWMVLAAKGDPGAGAGDVDGPASSTDNAVARFDGSTGKIIQNSSFVINDSGEVTTGVWKGTELTVPYGGTGASSFTAGALLKGAGQGAITTATAGTDYLAPAAIGATVQAYDADLAAIAALTPTADNFIVGNGTTWILETPAQARTSLGATTVGSNLLTLTNPSAIRFPRFNADNTVSALSDTDFRTAIGAYASSNPSGYTSNTGTVTSVGGTGSVNGITLTGTVTSSGSLTLGGTLSGVSLTTQITGTLGVGNGGTGVTTSTGTGSVVLSTTPTLVGTRETRVAVAASNIDLSAGNYFTRTISGTTTLTVSNTASSGTVSAFILDLTNGGSATVNWFSGVKWAGGTAPTLTSSGRDVLGFFTHDGGTTWNGFLLGKDVK
jgi:hypothetical protein